MSDRRFSEYNLRKRCLIILKYVINTVIFRGAKIKFRDALVKRSGVTLAFLTNLSLYKTLNEQFVMSFVR